MDNKDKLIELQKLNEDKLRKNVLIPLLGRMGFKGIRLNHGHGERGKDIICFDYDKLNNKIFYGIVAKENDLTGSVSSNMGLREVLYQIQQNFDNVYENLYDMRRVAMDQVWVITSGKIVSSAEQSIYSGLNKNNLEKLVRFIPGENLVDLIDHYYPTYWNDIDESIETIKGQRDRFIKVCRKILSLFGIDNDDIMSIVQQVLNSSEIPYIRNLGNYLVASANSYKIEYDKISDEYNHNFVTNVSGNVRKTYFEARRYLYESMWEVEEILSNYESVIDNFDPNNFVDAFYRELGDEYPFRNNYSRKADMAEENIQYLEQSLIELDEFLDEIREKGKMDWALTLIDSVDLLKDDIEKYLSTIEGEEFKLYWQVVKINDKDVVKLLYDGFNEGDQNILITEHILEVLNVGRNSWEPHMRPINVQDIIESVQFEIHEYIQNNLS